MELNSLQKENCSTTLSETNSINKSDSDYKKGIISEDKLEALIKDGSIKYICLCTPFITQSYIKTYEAEYFLKNIFNSSCKMAETNFTYSIDNTSIRTKELNLSSVNDIPIEIDKNSIRSMSWIGPEYAICMGVPKTNETPSNLHWCYPRNILTKLITQINEKNNVNFKVASELEFYVFNQKNMTITERYPEVNLNNFKLTKNSSDYCRANEMARNEEFTKKMKDNIRDCGIVLESLFSEEGPGQHEINIKYGEVLKNCDDHIYLKQCLKQTLYKENMGISFMAKPFQDYSGSSCHVHISAYDNNGENIFTAEESNEQNNTFINELPCSLKLIYFIGGILKYAEELFLIFAPNINSYKRFKKNSFAPYYVNTWCYDSRLSSVRVIGSGSNFHLEIRVGGADVDPYLIMTAIIASGMKGIEDKIMPNKMQVGNTYEEKNVLENNLRSPPRNLYESIILFEKSQFAEEVFGKEFKNTLVTMANYEWEEFMNHISNWEVDRYLDVV